MQVELVLRSRKRLFMEICYWYKVWGSCRGLVYANIKGPYDTGLWKEIRKDWEILLPRVGFIVGNGRRMQFWEDAWCGEAALCTLFPSLFALAAHKEALVADVWDSFRDAGVWSPHFIRMLND